MASNNSSNGYGSTRARGGGGIGVANAEDTTVLVGYTTTSKLLGGAEVFATGAVAITASSAANITADISANVTPRPSSETPLHSWTVQCRAGEGQRKRHPDSRTDLLVPDRPRPDRHEQRAEILDQERDPDREPVNGQEVEELHERDSDNPEDGELEQVATIDAQCSRRADKQEEHQGDRRACAPRFGQPQRGEPGSGARPWRPSR